MVVWTYFTSVPKLPTNKENLEFPKKIYIDSKKRIPKICKKKKHFLKVLFSHIKELFVSKHLLHAEYKVRQFFQRLRIQRQ